MVGVEPYSKVSSYILPNIYPEEVDKTNTKTIHLPFITRDNHIEQEMITIPAGIFQMGCDLDNKDIFDCTEYWVNGNELPLHTVFLSEYKIDKYEVTNYQYNQCVIDGACRAPQKITSYNRVSYYDNPEFENYPVIWVSWHDADDFCSWVGKRLPTEAEWEKAARGPGFTTRVYPWGTEETDCKYANLIGKETSNNCGIDTTNVTEYSNGGSFPYEVLNMAGNVWEWVNDWYQYDYYVESPYYNPLGPPETTEKVWRGGAFNSGWEDVRVARRAGISPNFRGNYIGFRCAK
jgi:serine/threonine-protein kinase